MTGAKISRHIFFLTCDFPIQPGNFCRIAEDFFF